MTRFIGILSGKGGVGKTTTSINLGVALTNLGIDVTIVDGNLTTPHIGLYLGVPSVPITIHDVLAGKSPVLNAIYRHASGVKIIPGDISLNALDKIELRKIEKTMKKLEGTSEVVIVDLSAGLGKELMTIMETLDEILIITTPDMLSVTDALKTASLAEEKGISVLGIVLNRVKQDETELSKENVETMIGKPVITTIKENQDIKKAQKIKNPVVYAQPKSEATKEYNKLARYLIGQEYETPMIATSWVKRILGKIGL